MQVEEAAERPSVSGLSRFYHFTWNSVVATHLHISRSVSLLPSADMNLLSVAFILVLWTSALARSVWSSLSVGS